MWSISDEHVVISAFKQQSKGVTVPHINVITGDIADQCGQLKARKWILGSVEQLNGLEETAALT